jgi:hypothetical protein
MPIEATPFEHVVVAVATKFTGEVAVPLFDGLVTKTPDCELTVILTGVVAAPPQ